MVKNNMSGLKGEAPKKYPWWKPDLKEPVKLHISVPLHTGEIAIQLDNSLRHSMATSILGDKLQVTTNFVTHDSLVCRARDKLAAYFLETDAEWQLQIDSDILFPFGLGQELAGFYSNWMGEETFNSFMNEGVFRLALSINALDEILRSGIQDGQKIVGGLYFWRGGKRNLNEAASVIPRGKDGEFQVEFKMTPDNYIQTDKLATGFLLVHRSVYEDMAQKYPGLTYSKPQYIPNKPMTAFYTPVVTEEMETLPDGSKSHYNYYRSEDYAFSWRAAQCGHNPCINMNILLGHIGTHIYSWFDRPILQKKMFEYYDNPRHFIEKE